MNVYLVDVELTIVASSPEEAERIAEHAAGGIPRGTAPGVIDVGSTYAQQIETQRR